MTDSSRYSGYKRERLISAVATTADASGLITLRLGPAPLGFVWQGTVTIPNAPSGALFAATVATTPWGQWAGPTNFGPIQLYGGETLVVTGNGLQANTQYAMQFFGVALPEELAEPIPPVAPLSTVSVETTTLLRQAVTMTAGNPGPSITITPPSLTRRLTLIVDSTNLTVDGELDIVGTTSNVVYGAVIAQAGAFQTVPIFIPIEPSVDATYSVFFSTGTGTVRLWILASTTNPMISGNAGYPVVVAGTASLSSLPVKTTGPAGNYNNQAAVALAVANNQTVIAAPGAGVSIYVQSIEIVNNALAAGQVSSVNLLRGSGGAIWAVPSINGPNQLHKYMEYPNGFRIGTNTAVVANVALNTCFIVITYAVAE